MAHDGIELASLASGQPYKSLHQYYSLSAASVKTLQYIQETQLVMYYCLRVMIAPLLTLPLDSFIDIRVANSVMNSEYCTVVNLEYQGSYLVSPPTGLSTVPRS